MIEKQFKIKVGTVRRVKKDLEYYAKERDAQVKKIEKMRQDEKDEYDIKKQEEVLIETETMLPDCQMRLKEASEDLKTFIETNQKEIETLETFPEAQELLATVPSLL